MNYNNVSLVVYSETLNDMGCFKRLENGKIEVSGSNKNYEYQDLNSYWQNHWEFIGTLGSYELQD